jgi:hypothetical protein
LNMIELLGTTTETLLHFGIRPIIKHIGYDSLDTHAIFYYWETFHRSVEDAIATFKTLDDEHFNKKIFSTNTFLDKIYDYITTIAEDSSHSLLLFEVPNDKFKKKQTYNISNFEKSNELDVYHSNIELLYKSYKQQTLFLQKEIRRDLLPKCSWSKNLGNYIFDYVRFTIDGTEIEELTDEIINIYNNQAVKGGQRSGYNKMIGNTNEMLVPRNVIGKNRIYTELPLCFKSTVKALPIIAMGHSTLMINVNVKALEELVHKPPKTKIILKGKLKIKLLSSYVYLADEERKKFAQSRHEYLLELKVMQRFHIDKISDNWQIDFHNPCKELKWFYISKKVKKNHQHGNYTGIVSKDYFSNPNHNVYDVDDDVKRFVMALLTNKEKLHNTIAPTTSHNYTEPMNVYALDSDDRNKFESFIKNRPEPQNPIELSRLKINGKERFEVEGIMSGTVVGMMHYGDTFINGVNGYTFARHPKNENHSGYINFNNFNDINFKTTLGLDADIEGEIIVIINSYNVLRIASGLAATVW